MKSIAQITMFLLFVLMAYVAKSQEQKSNENLQQSTVTKENHNATRSNKSAVSAPVDHTSNGNVIETNDPNAGAAASKKGYDYYKAKSDMNSSGAQNNPKDHNSSRSNKSASQIDQGSNSGSDEKRVNKIESITVKQK